MRSSLTHFCSALMNSTILMNKKKRCFIKRRYKISYRYAPLTLPYYHCTLVLAAWQTTRLPLKRRQWLFTTLLTTDNLTRLQLLFNTINVVPSLCDMLDNLPSDKLRLFWLIHLTLSQHYLLPYFDQFIIKYLNRESFDVERNREIIPILCGIIGSRLTAWGTSLLFELLLTFPRQLGISTVLQNLSAQHITPDHSQK